MDKSVFTADYRVVLTLLKEVREGAGVSQVELAQRLGQSQSFVSKVERGERRLDVIQLRTICLTLGTTLTNFVRTLEERLPASSKKAPRSRP